MFRPVRFLVVMFIASSVYGSPQFSATNQTGDGVNTFTPTYTISPSSLIAGMAASASGGTFTLETSGGLGVLTDGSFGDIFTGGNGPHPAFATAGGGGGSGTFVTYSLDTGTSPGGYDLSQIDVYGGWNDSGRDEQEYTVAYSLIGDPTTFIDLKAVDFNPSIDSNVQSAIDVTFTDDTLPFLATGVAALRFTFDPSPENGYTGYAEISVIGSPSAVVPEPATLSILGIVPLLLIRRTVATGC